MDLLSEYPPKLQKFATVIPPKHGEGLVWSFPSITANAIVDDNDICVLCGEWCAREGGSNRYIGLQGSFYNTNHPPCLVSKKYNISVVHFCDKCYRRNDYFDDINDEVQTKVKILGHSFCIDQEIRMND